MIKIDRQNQTENFEIEICVIFMTKVSFSSQVKCFTKKTKIRVWDKVLQDRLRKVRKY